MTTIPRNHKRKIQRARESVTRARVYDQSSGLLREIEPAKAWKYYDERPEFAKLIDMDNGKYTIRVHSNLWFDLYSEGE